MFAGHMQTQIARSGRSAPQGRVLRPDPWRQSCATPMDPKAAHPDFTATRPWKGADFMSAKLRSLSFGRVSDFLLNASRPFVIDGRMSAHGSGQELPVVRVVVHDQDHVHRLRSSSGITARPNQYAWSCAMAFEKSDHRTGLQKYVLAPAS